MNKKILLSISLVVAVVGAGTVGYVFLQRHYSSQPSATETAQTSTKPTSQPVTIDAEEILYSVARESFNLDLSGWKKVNNTSFTISIPGDCITTSVTEACVQEAPLKETLAIVAQGIHPLANDTGIDARYAVLVERGRGLLDIDIYSHEHDSYDCVLLVRTKKSNVVIQEYLGKVYEEHYTGGDRPVHGCDGFKLSWDEAGYPVLKDTITSGPFIFGVYVTNENTIHWVNGSYKLDSETSEEGELGEVEKN